MFKGLVASVVASVLFGAMYYLAPELAPLDGEQIFGWRVLATLPFTTVLLLALGQWRRVRLLARRVQRQPWFAIGLLASAALLGVQLWLFLWAPLHGRALPVSLGYFLLPLVMVLAGRLLYREQLTRLQWLATLLAGLGVAHELLRAGGMSWETWLVAAGYTVYFVLRRQLATDHLGGHWLDMLLLVPAALWFVQRAPSAVDLVAGHPHLWAMVPVLGLVSAVA
ncbi:MAG: EamA family transporter RarD, partial [Proteobacteria bacterium]|nr:EamA family transporter RarD [Pseudomonadota bacterium]